MMIATSIEQSKRLLELGLNPETSDMIYSMVDGRSTPFVRKEPLDEMWESDVPAWSLEALLKLLPHTYYSKEQEYCELTISKNSYGEFHVFYNNSKRIGFGYHSRDYIEAVYRVIVWLLENGYISSQAPETISND